MALTKISTAMISQSAAAVDLNVDAGTFYVDTTNNRVGVGGKTDPDTPLHVIGTVTATLFAGSGASLTSIPNSALTNSSITINSTATSLGGSITLTTANIAENTNLYYTDARADARIAAADTDDLSEGSSNLYYTDARVDARVSGGSLGNITTTGYIRGPSSFTIDPAAHGDNSGTVVIAGNLQVDGTTTTINSTTMTVDDKNITLASGSANAAAASGAGFTVDIGSGTNPTITYDGTNDEWDFNKDINVTGSVVADGLTVDAAQSNFNDSAGSVIAFQKSASAKAWIANRSYGFHDGNGLAINTTDANPIRFGTNNSERVRIDASGQLMLGTTTGTGIIRAFGSTGRLIIGDTNNNYYDANTHNFRNYSASIKMILDSSGNLGIGTTAPTQKLQVNGPLVSTDQLASPGSAGAYTYNATALDYSSNGARLWSWGSSSARGTFNFIQLENDGQNQQTAMSIDSSGNVGIDPSSGYSLVDKLTIRGSQSQLRIQDSSADAKGVSLLYSNGNNYGQLLCDHRGNNQLNFYYSALNHYFGRNTSSSYIYMTLTDTGNVGIGTTAPSTKLTVKNDNATTSFGDNNIITIQNANTTDNSRMGLAFTGNTNIGSGLALVEGVSYDQSHGHTSLNFSVYNGSWHNDMMVLKAGRVGIGETDPDFKLHVKDTNTQIAIESTTTNQNSSLYYRAHGASQWETGVNITAGLDYEIYDRVNNSARMVVQHDGKIRIGNNIPMWSGAYGGALVLKGNNATSDRYAQLTIVDSNGSIAYTGLTVNNSGNVNIGTSSAYSGATLSVAGSTVLANGSQFVIGTFGTSGLQLIGTAGGDNIVGTMGSSEPLLFRTGSTERMRIDSSGNIGFGVTPNANWSSSYRAIDAFGGATLQFEANSTRQGQNFYGYPWKYKSTRTATSIAHTSGGDISFQVAPSGTADTAITWSQAMIVKNGGNVGIGTTTPAAPLDVKFVDNTNAQRWSYGSSEDNFYLELDTNIPTGGVVTYNFNTKNNGTSYNNNLVLDRGNVGIGTSTPSYPLHISGTGHQRLKIEKTDAGGDADVQLSSKNDSTQWILFHDRDSGNNSGVIKYVHSTNKMHFRTNDVDDRLVISSDGNVGIGTSSPGSTLDLTNTSDTAERAIRIENSSARLYVGVEGSSGNRFVGSGTNNGFIGTTTNDGLEFGTNNNVRMVINTSGNVGIGTTNPGKKLEVAGVGNTDGIRITGGSANVSLIINNTGNNGVAWDISSTGAGHGYGEGALHFGVGFGTPKMKIKSDGKVGIGLNDPSAFLHVQSSTQADTTVAQLELATTVNANPSHINQKFSSGAGWIGMIQAEQRAAGQYGALNFWTANGGNPTQAMTLNYAGDLSVGEVGVEDSPHPLHKVVEVTATAATSNAWNTSSGSNGGYDVSNNDSGTSSNRGSISAAGYYNHHVAHFSMRGNFSANTWYPFTTRTQLQTWIPGASSSPTTGMPMYFRIYTYDVSAGGGDYLTHRLTDRFWFTTYGSNSNQRHQIPIGPGMGHAPNSGAYTDHKDYGNNPIQVAINHRYGSDSYYPGSQTFEILFKSARTSLDGTNATQVEIYAYIG